MVNLTITTHTLFDILQINGKIFDLNFDQLIEYNNQLIKHNKGKTFFSKIKQKMRQRD